jgi:hypothetical protein
VGGDGTGTVTVEILEVNSTSCSTYFFGAVEYFYYFRRSFTVLRSGV